MMSLIKKIIVTTDFSEKSLNAVHTAIQMCQRHGAELHLLYVVETSKVFPVEGILAPIANINDEIMEKDIFMLKELTRSINEDKGIACTCHHKIGFPVQTLCETASELDCDLVVVATENEESSLGFLFDSAAYQVLKNANCSVLAVPAEKRLASFGNVIFPVRTKNDVVGKYNFSRAILKLNHAKVVMMGLLSKPTKKMDRAIKDLLAQLGQFMEEDLIPYVSGVIVSNDPASSTKEAGEHYETDLIIINASTKRNLVQFFAGNFTQRLLNRKEFAVLCYKPKRQRTIPQQENTFSTQMAFG
ncbi:universal stress protein [Pedobacter sp. Du54]|uniref:universal stress protein n=1 Tax=Pedobacter anseongensis TaxID=3133439 RepID=UPI0030AB50D5